MTGGQFAFLAVVVAFSQFLAWRGGFYALPKTGLRPHVQLKDLLLLFLLYIATALLIVPGIFFYFFGPEIARPQIQGMVNITSIAVCFTLLFGYTFYAKKKVLGSAKEGLFDLAIGVGTCLLAYPVVALYSSFAATLIGAVLEYEPVDQVAVQHMKGLMEYPLLFSGMVFCVIFLVPAIEELLFRGYLQSWLRGRLGSGRALFLTSLIFALFHYSSGQGLSNLEVVSTLFLFSCYLGLLYEKRRSLIAPLALHSTFNAASILLILTQK